MNETLFAQHGNNDSNCTKYTVSRTASSGVARNLNWGRGWWLRAKQDRSPW